MKKIYVVAAAAALIASACSKDESLPKFTTDPVAFGTYVDASVSRVGVKGSFAVGDSFGVFGYYTGTADYAPGYAPNFFFNQAITKTADGWTYSPLKYWPNRVSSEGDYGKVSLFAYWPMPDAGNGVSVVTTNASQTDPVIRYDATDATKQVDLLWGVEGASGLPYLDLIKTDAAAAKVKFTFKHALSRVGFSVKLAGDILSHEAATDGETLVTINHIEFGGTINPTDPEGALVGALTRKADLNLNNAVSATPSWANPSGDLYSLTLTNFTDDGVFGTTALPFDEGSVTTNTDASYFMIIPETSAATDVVMRINYTITTTDPGLLGGKSEITNIHTKVISANFVGGKSYKYRMTIGLNSVQFDEPIITEWADTETPVEVEVN